MVRLMLLALGLALLAGNLAVAQPQPPDKPPQPADTPPQPPKARPPDPIGDNLFPPELIWNCADQIGLTAEQRESLRAQGEKVQGRFQELMQRVEQEKQALVEILKQEHPDADEAVARLDKVMDTERDLRRLHITFFVALKNLLTPDQQAQIREIRKKMMAEGKGGMPGGDVPQAVQMKMMNVQRQAQELAKEGRDVAAVREAMGRFEPLIRERKFAEAEAVLDEALKVLGEIAGGQ